MWTALMQLAFVPLYIQFMGMESFGLVGFFGTLITMLSVLDMGLSTTLNREMARQSALPGKGQIAPDLVRTMEIIYWAVAILLGASVLVLAGPIAKYWVNPEKLSVTDVRQAVLIMGFVTALRWPFGLYQGGLLGLQKQVLVNGVNIFTSTLRGVGAVLVLWLVEPTVQAYFGWQVIVSGIETFTMAFFLWHSLPPSKARPRFQRAVLGQIWRFATGVVGINFSNMILSQVDKVILSKILTLEMFGLYMLAWNLAVGLIKLASPVFSALFPRFSEVLAIKDISGLTVLYHKSCQLTSVIVLPIAAVLCIFSQEVMLIWTSDPYIARNTHLILSFLIIGAAFYCMINIPYALQLAYGWTSLTLWANIATILLFTPLYIWLVPLYGVVSAAAIWTISKMTYMFISVPLMHRQILKGELCFWFFNDLGVPLVAVLVPTLIGKSFCSELSSTTWMLLWLGLITGLSFVFALGAASRIRYDVLNMAIKLCSKLNASYVRMSQ
jgi:O-antigen/teichoic acid export membrane protein